MRHVENTWHRYPDVQEANTRTDVKTPGSPKRTFPPKNRNDLKKATHASDSVLMRDENDTRNSRLRLKMEVLANYTPRLQ